MFDLIPRIKNRRVSGEISVENLVDALKNPSFTQKALVDKARTLPKDSVDYHDLKASLPCIVPNYRHNGYIKAATIKKPTGYLYIDIDNDISFDPTPFDYVVACWKSLSGKGKGVLVSVDNLPTDNIEKGSLDYAVQQIATLLGIEPDKAAISRDRLNVIGYDKDVYYNPSHTTYSVEWGTINNSTNNSTNKGNSKKVSKGYNKSNNIRLQPNDTFYSKDIRLTDIDEKLKKYHFGEDEVYLDLEEDKIKYSSVFIPPKIEKGGRNSKLFYLSSAVFGLNPNIEENRLTGYMRKVNSSVCDEPLREEEINNICRKVYKQGPTLYQNKTKRFIFNTMFELSGSERKSIAARETGLKRGKATTEKIINTILRWDVAEEGKITYKKVAEATGVSEVTIKRRSKTIRPMIKEMNQDLKKAA